MSRRLSPTRGSAGVRPSHRDRGRNFKRAGHADALEHGAGRLQYAGRAFQEFIGDINEDGFGATSIDMGYGGEGNAVKKTR